MASSFHRDPNRIPSTPPPDYTRQANFTQYESNHPGQAPRGTDLDGEFNKLGYAVAGTQDRLALIQRPDGNMVNGIVGADALNAVAKTITTGAWNPVGIWSTGTVYSKRDVVAYNNVAYVASIDHTASATFQTDLDAGYWVTLSVAGSLIAEAQTYAQNAGSSAAQSATSASASATSAQTATTKANDAAQSASTAQSEAGAASNSANAAASAETNAQQSAAQAANNYQTFKNVFQGVYASAPTSRPDGTALQPGDVYLDTTAGTFEFYYNSTWRPVYTATGLASTAQGQGSSLVGDSSGATVHDLLPIHLQFLTYADLRNYSHIQGVDIVQITGDGIEGFFKADLSDTTTADNGGTVIVAADGMRWKRDWDKYLDPRWFGAVFDGTTDDAPAIQAAIAEAKAAGGGRIRLGLGVTAIGSTLTLDDIGVSIYGLGRGGNHDVTASRSAPTVLRWIGASGGTMIHVNPASTYALRACDVADLYLDGNNDQAAIGLNVVSCNDSTYRIAGKRFSGALFQTDCATTLNEGADVQNNDIWINGRQLQSGDGQIAVFKGSQNPSGTFANFSLNRIHEINGDHLADAIYVYNADNNDFYLIRVYRVSGTANGVRLRGDGSQACRSNVFYHLSTNGGVSSDGSSYANPAVDNQILFYDKENNSPDPAIGTGSTLWWGSNHAPVGQRTPIDVNNHNQITYSDGRIRYSGNTGSLAANASYSVTFPVAFASRVIKASAIADTNGGGTGVSAQPTTTGITIWNRTSTTTSFWWECEGF